MLTFLLRCFAPSFPSSPLVYWVYNNLAHNNRLPLPALLLAPVKRFWHSEREPRRVIVHHWLERYSFVSFPCFLDLIQDPGHFCLLLSASVDGRPSKRTHADRYQRWCFVCTAGS